MRTRVVTIVLLASGVCAMAVPAAAQAAPKPPPSRSDEPRAEISGGYSYLWERGTGGNPANIYDKGWVAAVAWRAGRTPLAIVAEAGATYRLDAFGERQSLIAVLGGVRLPLVHVWRFATYAQALTGVEAFRQPGFNTHGMAFQPGVVVDLPVRRAIRLRAQGDFRIAHEEGINFQEARFAAGVVIRLR